jgi:ERCC4-type nuclease
MTRLEYGDAAFIGNGPKGPCPIGVEIKAVRDALNCILDGRFAGHQLPGLVRMYERVWMVVEGDWSPNFSDGILVVGRGRHARPVHVGQRRFMYRDLDNWLTTMEICAGISIRRTRDRVETARVVADLFGWFSKEFSSHKAHLQFSSHMSEWTPPAAQFRKPSLARRVAAELPGIGWTKSQDVERQFPTMERMCGGGVGDWASVPGIGNLMAKRIHDSIRGKS